MCHLTLFPGRRDAAFLERRISDLWPSLDRSAELIRRADQDGIFIQCLVYKLRSFSDADDGETAYFFPVDLSRYPLDRLQRWLDDNEPDIIVVLHGRSKEALCTIGYGEGAFVLPVPPVEFEYLPKRHSLSLRCIYKAIDTLERDYDPERLIPGHQKNTIAGETNSALLQPGTPVLERTSRPSLRFRLGATRRHMLNLYRELREGGLSIQENEYRDIDRLGECCFEELSFSGAVYTTVIEGLDEESGWVDLVKAFSAVFKEQPDVTLLIYLPDDIRERNARDLDHVLCSLYPFSCRFLLLQGSISDGEYLALMACTDVYIDTGRRITLRSDLRQFAASGVLTVGFPLSEEDVGDSHLIDFPLSYCIQPSFCDAGTDPRYQTTTYRLDWSVLLAALKLSFGRIAQANINGETGRVERPSSGHRQLLNAWKDVLAIAPEHADAKSLA